MKLNSKVCVVVCACAALSFSTRAYSQAQNLRVAVVNVEKIYAAYDKAQADGKAMKVEADAKQADLEKMKAELKEMRSDFDAKKDKMKDTEKKTAEQKIVEKAQAVLAFAQQNNAAIQKKSTAQAQVRLGEVSAVINKLAEGKFDLVIDKKYTPYFDSKLDISDRVIEKLNAGR